MKTALKQAVIIVVLSAIVGLTVNTPLIVRWARGEFRDGFVSLKEQGAYVVIGQEQAMDLFQAGDAVFIDSRSPAQYAHGHIPGARNIPAGDARKEDLLASLNAGKTTPVVVYCSGGACLDSLHLAQWLSDHQAFDRIFVFQGGWESWMSLGLPVETSDDQE
jgi:rhodanese-related sulfurtransferase